MTAVLILGGVLLCLLGWLLLWWGSRHTGLVWLLLSLLLPLALLDGLRHLRRSWPGVLLCMAGAGFALTGLWQLQQQQPDQYQALIRLDWLPNAAANTQGVNGRLRGQRFQPVRAELRDGVLVLGEGENFLEAAELRLDLGAGLHYWQGEPLSRDVLPDDVRSVPVLELLGPDPDSGEPVVLRVSRGYLLRLSLQEDAGRYGGELFLTIPGQLDTRLEGRFQLTGYQPRPRPQAPRPAQPAAAPEPAEPVDIDRQLELSQLQTYPERYLQQELEVELLTGKRIRGSFQGWGEEGGLLIRQPVQAPGFVVFELAPSDIRQVTRL